MEWLLLVCTLNNKLFLLSQTSRLDFDKTVNTSGDKALVRADQCDDAIGILETVNGWLCHVPLGVVSVEFDVEVD